MKKLSRVLAALGVIAGLLVLAAPPSSAGGPGGFEVTVTGEAVCLDSGDVQVTWTAVIDVVAEPVETLPPLEPLRLRLTGAGNAVVQFNGTQSGALSGDVTFDPFEQTIVASSSSFPVSSEAVATGSAPEGGTVDLDVDVLVYDPLNPEQNNFTVSGAGSVDLPVCAQPLASTASAAPAAETRPTFTG